MALASAQDLGVAQDELLLVHCFPVCKRVELRVEPTSPVLGFGTMC
jgi:hypothetical protein